MPSSAEDRGSKGRHYR